VGIKKEGGSKQFGQRTGEKDRRAVVNKKWNIEDSFLAYQLLKAGGERQVQSGPKKKT